MIIPGDKANSAFYDLLSNTCCQMEVVKTLLFQLVVDSGNYSDGDISKLRRKLSEVEEEYRKYLVAHMSSYYGATGDTSTHL